MGSLGKSGESGESGERKEGRKEGRKGLGEGCAGLHVVAPTYNLDCGYGLGLRVINAPHHLHLHYREATATTAAAAAAAAARIGAAVKRYGQPDLVP